MLDLNTVLQNRYRIIKQGEEDIGGTFYRAVDNALGSTVYLKEIPGEVDEVRRAYEHSVLTNLNHPALPRVLDFFTANGSTFIAMRFAAGDNLMQVVHKRGGRLPVEEVVKIGQQLLEAAQYLHTRKPPIHYLAVDPQILQLTRRGTVAICNIGWIDTGMRDTSGQVASNANIQPAPSPFAPPEKIIGGELGPYSDIYSIAASMYFLMTGVFPVDASTRIAAVEKREADPLQPAYMEGVPRRVAGTLSRALALEPTHRWNSADRMRSALMQAWKNSQLDSRVDEVEETETPADSKDGAPSQLSVSGQSVQSAGEVSGVSVVEGEMPVSEVAHVLFMDIVGFSRNAEVSTLIQLQNIIAAGTEFKRAAEHNEILRLPTGDGMALVFFGDPAAPVKCALEIGRAIKDHPAVKLRMGVHSGPAQRFTDITGKSNIAGAAVNIAQQVMDFGDAGHILISRNAAEAAKHLQGWEELMHDLGEVEVKHGVKVHVLNCYTDEIGNPAIPKIIEASLPPSRKPPGGLQQSPQSRQDNQSARLRHAIESKFPYPIARSFYVLRSFNDWQAEIQQLSNLLGTAIEHLAILAMVEYFSGSTREPSINESISSKLGKSVSLGTWVSIVRETLTFLSERNHKAFAPELFECYLGVQKSGQSHVAKLIDELVSQRNAFAHPKRPPLREEHRRFKSKMIELLQALSFLKDYPLVSVKFTESKEGIKSHACNLHMGFHDTFEQVSVQCDLDLEKTRVAMLNPHAGEMQYLHPFYVLRECAGEGCGAVHLFHFDKLDKNRVEYLSASGHRLRDTGAAGDFKSILQSPFFTRTRQKAKYLYLSSEESSEWHRLPVGQRVDGKYEVVEWLRRGGMADVYKVKEGGTGCYRALKLLPFQFLSDQKMVQRFRQEAMQSQSLTHQNITRVFDYGEDLVDHYLVMELADGWSQEGRRPALDVGELPKPLRVSQALSIIKQACEGLDYIHRQKIVHRDIKPGNLLLFGEGLIKLADFGIARSREAITLTMTGLAMGTPEYMSPEQAEGKRDLSPASDIYSLGVLMYELLAGEPPFKRATPLATAIAHLHEKVPPLTELNSAVPNALQKIVLRCLSKEPEKRFESARSLYQAIIKFEQDGDAEAAEPTDQDGEWIPNVPLLHEGAIYSIAFSPDGNTVASASGDAAVHLWDLGSGGLVEKLPHNAKVVKVGYSSDGRTLASLEAESKVIQLWDTVTFKKRFELRTDFTAITFAFSPTGKFLASSGDDFNVRLWNLETGKQELILDHEFRAVSLAFSPGGELLACGCYKEALLWDVSSGEVQRKLTHDGNVSSVLFSPDGTTLALAIAGEMVSLWDVKTGVLKRRLRSDSKVLPISFSPDGKVLAGGGWEGTVELWNMETGELGATLREHKGIVSAVSFSVDGKVFATGSWDQTLRLWNRRGGTGRILSAEAKADGIHYEVAEQEPAAEPDAVANSKRKDSAISRLSVKSLATTFKGHDGSVNAVAFSHDGETIASGGSDMMVRLWNAKDGSLRQVIKAHDTEVTSLAFSSDDSLLMTGSYDKTVRLWDVNTGESRRTLIWYRNPAVDAVAFSPDGMLGASGGEMREDINDELKMVERSGEINIWETQLFRLKRTLTGHEFTVTSVAFFPDSRRLVSGSWDKTLRVWDVGTGMCMHTLKEHTGAVYAVAVSPDGRTIASASEDQTIKLWGAETGELKQTITGHSSRVLALAYSPDGKTLASAGGEHQKWGEVKLWDMTVDEIQQMPGSREIISHRIGWEAQEHRLKQTLRGHNGAILSLAFSPDSNRLASASSDGTVRLWSLKERAGQVPEHVLWVDDKPENNESIIKRLRQEGVKVIEALTTNEAMSILIKAAPRIDVIVSDMGRREEGEYRAKAGLILIKAVRRAGIDVPIYIYSAADNNEEVIASGGSASTTSAFELFELVITSMMGIS